MELGAWEMVVGVVVNGSVWGPGETTILLGHRAPPPTPGAVNFPVAWGPLLFASSEAETRWCVQSLRQTLAGLWNAFSLTQLLGVYLLM